MGPPRFKAAPHPDVRVLQGDNSRGAHWRDPYFVYKSDPAARVETVVVAVRGCCRARVTGCHTNAMRGIETVKTPNHAIFSTKDSAGGACSRVSRGVQSGSKSWLVYHHFS
jgi:hypothetical protein